MTSAIENVLRNAVHHSPANSQVEIRLSVNQANTAVIEIADKGTGVDAADLPRLFEPFFRTRQSTDDNQQNGTGLGLAIARRAIELNGGEIAAANRADGGLRISISLPVTE